MISPVSGSVLDGPSPKQAVGHVVRQVRHEAVADIAEAGEVTFTTTLRRVSRTGRVVRAQNKHATAGGKACAELRDHVAKDSVPLISDRALRR